MATDLEQLHNVVLNNLQGRQVGKTFARIHELATNIEFNYFAQGIVIISYYRDLDYLKPMIDKIFYERCIQYKWKNSNTLLSGRTTIYFVPEHKLDDFLRGRDNYFIVNMRYWD